MHSVNIKAKHVFIFCHKWPAPYFYVGNYSKDSRCFCFSQTVSPQNKPLYIGWYRPGERYGPTGALVITQNHLKIRRRSQTNQTCYDLSFISVLCHFVH